MPYDPDLIPFKQSTTQQTNPAMPPAPTRRPLFSRKRSYALIFITALLIAIIPAGLYTYQRSQQSSSLASQAAVSDVQQLPSFLNTTASYTPPVTLVKYVAPNGSDSASGDTVDTPYKSICKALASVSAGGTVVLRGGVYREGSGGSSNCNSYKVGKKINLQSYMNERAWVKGSLVATNWQADGGNRWKTSWSYLSNLESTVPSSNNDAIGPSNPLGGDAAQVFINGASLKQVVSVGEVKTGTFYADRGSKTVYIGSNPAGNTVEITAYPRFIYFTSGAAGSSVSGIGFAQFGTSWNQSTNPGALLLQGDSITLDNTVFTQNAAWGVAMIAGHQNLRSSVLSYNGHDGVLGNRLDGSVIENSVFDHNNTEHLGAEACSASCTSAGVKLAHVKNITVRNNTFSNNYGYGFWCDLTCQDLTFVNNTSHDNLKGGIFFEVSSGAIIASNLFYNNKTMGIRLSGSDHVRIYNNTLVNNGTSATGLEGAIGVYDDTRAPEAYGVQQGVSWNTSNVEIVNNLMAYNVQSPFLDIRKSAQVAAESMVTKMSSNAYYRKTASQPSVVIHRAGSADIRSNTLASAIASKIESSTSIANDSNGTLFTGDTYLVDPKSAAYHKAEAIPADILKAIGNPSGPLSIGYIGASQLELPGPPTATPVINDGTGTVPPETPTKPADNPSSDKTAPSVKVTAPTPSQQVSGVFTLKADASDNKAVAKVEFYVNGFFIGADTSAPYEVNWTSSLANDGNYPVTAIAYDTAGNKTTSSAVQVTAKNGMDLGVTLTQPTNGATIGKNAKYTLAATTSGNVEIGKVEFYINGFLIGADSSVPYQIYWNNTGVANGKYPVVAKAYSTDGRLSTSDSVTITLKK